MGFGSALPLFGCVTVYGMLGRTHPTSSLILGISEGLNSHPHRKVLGPNLRRVRKYSFAKEYAEGNVLPPGIFGTAVGNNAGYSELPLESLFP